MCRYNGPLADANYKAIDGWIQWLQVWRIKFDPLDWYQSGLPLDFGLIRYQVWIQWLHIWIETWDQFDLDPLNFGVCHRKTTAHLASVTPLFILQASNEDPEDVFQPDEDMLEAFQLGSGHWTFQVCFWRIQLDLKPQPEKMWDRLGFFHWGWHGVFAESEIADWLPTWTRLNHVLQIQFLEQGQSLKFRCNLSAARRALNATSTS